MHQSFNFPLRHTDGDASALKPITTRSLKAFDAVGAPGTWVLSNHDVPRHATRPRRAHQRRAPGPRRLPGPAAPKRFDPIAGFQRCRHRVAPQPAGRDSGTPGAGAVEPGLDPRGRACQKVRSLLSNPRGRPTALLCASDEMAFGAIRAARYLVLSLPGDFSAIGIDGHELGELHGLATIAQHPGAQVQAAVTRIFELPGADEPAGTPTADEFYPTGFVPPTSTAQPA